MNTIMKRYISILALAATALCLTSCEKFLDDVHREGETTQATYFVNDAQAVSAIARVYSELRQESYLGREMYWEQAVATDIVWGRTRSYNPLAVFQYNGDESPLRDVFNQAYKNIAVSNWIVEALHNKQIGTELTEIETRTLGEAYFLRAYCHFTIAYRYGTKDLGVPFDAYEEFEYPYQVQIPTQQESVMKNYEMIASDLKKAESLLPKFETYGAADRGRAHKASAAAVLSKVYAYWANWDSSKWSDVITCVDRLEKDYGRDLVENFKDLWSPDWQKGFWNKEYCWGVPGNGGNDADGGGGIEFTGVSWENKGYGKMNGWGQFKPAYDIYEEMAKDNVGDTKNERLAVSILEYNDEFMYWGAPMKYYSVQDLESGFQIAKYIQPLAPEDPFTYDGGYVNTNADYPTVRCMWHIVRFADCLLLRAEAYLAQNNASKAAEDINRVRVRSNLVPITGNATWTDLYHERRCELAFEMSADHAYDCKRWAYSGAAEIKALAIKELNSHPRVRHHEDRSNPESDFTIGDYEDYKIAKQWSNKYMTFPYPSQQINKSQGKLKNVPDWQ